MPDDYGFLVSGGDPEVLDELGGSSRSVVRRIRAGSGTAILKEFLDAGEGWVRESAALTVLPPGSPAPRLLAERAAPPAVLMTDAGRGPNVADALLGDDPARAADAVLDWARAIATLHRSSSGLRSSFRAALAERAGDLPVAESTTADGMAGTAAQIERHCADLDIDVPPGAITELAALGTRLTGDGPAALTPADACPDNNVITGDGLVLLDFEGAEWRHPAWDVAYLTVPWPSCWCSWRLPEAVTDRAVSAYRAASAQPWANAPEFAEDVAAATLGWTFLSASWFLPKALADDPPLLKAGPTRRAMILHRLAGAAASPQPGALPGLAARLHEILTARWGDLPLAYAPAFRTGAGPAE